MAQSNPEMAPGASPFARTFTGSGPTGGIVERLIVGDTIDCEALVGYPCTGVTACAVGVLRFLPATKIDPALAEASRWESIVMIAGQSESISATKIDTTYMPEAANKTRLVVYW